MKKALLLFLILSNHLYAQQVADSSYMPSIANPAYEINKGPVVFIDEGHHNFHTKSGRYYPFAKLLERDGYQLKAYTGTFNRKELDKGKILVISNALNQHSVGRWYLPTPSAFTTKEMEIIKKWVEDGGSLFLIADHMPMAGAAKDLALVFGFEFTNGFAMDTTSNTASIFTLKDSTLFENTITKGKNSEEQIKSVASFTGQAFKIPQDAIPILTFPSPYINMLPDTAWVFNSKTTTYPIKGWSQGAYKTVGKGKVVVFGEAAMFTAQLAGANRSKTGMNHPSAAQNYQLLLNIIHWLDGKL